MREITIRKQNEKQRLDKFLRRYLPEAENGFLYKMLRKKNIKLNGQKASGRELLQE
ncbi:MAG TPA: RluA family pseudouridine synthase, partial [Lachnospiraceae bacterium]|nr:RluA family pseudouridine synthase [Lachnospiraceae bacterium]